MRSLQLCIVSKIALCLNLHTKEFYTVCNEVRAAAIPGRAAPAAPWFARGVRGAVVQNRSPPAAAAVVPDLRCAASTLRPIRHRCTSSGPSTRCCIRTSAYQAASGVSRV